MPRPQIKANGGSPGVKASVAASSTVTLTLDSLLGVRSVAWTVLATDETGNSAAYPLTISGDRGQTATFTALGAGTALIIQVQINNGLVQSLPNLPDTTNTIKVYVPTTDGFEVGATGEAYESDPVHGTTAIINTPIRALAGYSEAISTIPAKIARASAITNLALSGIPSSGNTDGVTLVANDTVLLTNQSAPAENGLWLVAAGAWTRPDNFSSASGGDVRANLIFIIAGTLRAGWVYQVTNTAAVTIDTTAITLARFTDRHDRATLATATATPTADALTKYNGSGQLVANAFVSGTGTPAGAGLLRAQANSVAVAFKSALTAGDYTAVSADSADRLTLGGAAWASVILSADTGASVDFLLGATTVASLALTRLTFDRTATMRLYHDATPTGAGKTTSIEAQATGSGAGGSIELIVGSGTTAHGDIRLDLGGGAGGVTGDFVIAGGAIGDVFTAYYDDGQPGWFISATNAVDFICNGLYLHTGLSVDTGDHGNFSVEPDGIGLGGGGSFGGGQRVVYIVNRDTAPTTNPSGGGVLYAEAGAGKWRGSSGTVTTFGPAEPHCTTCGRDFAHEWKNDDKGEHLAVCVPCMLGEMHRLGANIDRFAFVKSLGKPV